MDASIFETNRSYTRHLRCHTTAKSHKQWSLQAQHGRTAHIKSQPPSDNKTSALFKVMSWWIWTGIGLEDPGWRGSRRVPEGSGFSIEREGEGVSNCGIPRSAGGVNGEILTWITGDRQVKTRGIQQDKKNNCNIKVWWKWTAKPLLRLFSVRT